MNYDKIIDAETWAFIEETGRYYPPDAVHMTVAEQREVYDRMCRAFFQGYPEGVRAEDIDANGVPCRHYQSSQPRPVTVVYFHGGGFVVGGLESHDDVCAEICERTGYRVISVDYRMSPEHPHPAAFDDCWAAVQHVLAEFPGPLVLAGDSAGGNLAAAVAHHARGRTDRIKGQVLIYPGLGGDHSKGTYLSHAHAPLLTLEDIEFYMSIRTGGPAPEGDPTYAPLHDTDFSGLPPSVVITAECDPISGDGEDYRDRLQQAGVPVVWINEAGLVHGYLRARVTVRRARESFDRIVAAIDALGQGDWPYS